MICFLKNCFQKMVHLRSVVKAELNTELKTELKTKSSLMNSSNPQYGKINRNGKCINGKRLS